uniref:Uncharacterized protein n=1 Tax=Glossina pallidipes TaxID=7398 RepID=A0A1A9Z323_GLOPL
MRDYMYMMPTFAWEYHQTMCTVFLTVKYRKCYYKSDFKFEYFFKNSKEFRSRQPLKRTTHKLTHMHSSAPISCQSSIKATFNPALAGMLFALILCFGRGAGTLLPKWPWQISHLPVLAVSGLALVDGVFDTQNITEYTSRLCTKKPKIDIFFQNTIKIICKKHSLVRFCAIGFMLEWLLLHKSQLYDRSDFWDDNVLYTSLIRQQYISLLYMVLIRPRRRPACQGIKEIKPLNASLNEKFDEKLLFNIRDGDDKENSRFCLILEIVEGHNLITK